METSFSKRRVPRKPTSRRPAITQTILVAVVAGLAASMNGCAIDTGGFRETETHEFRFEPSDRPWTIRARVDDGEIRVVEADGNEVEVDFEVIARANSKERARKLLESMRVYAEERDGEIVVTARRESTGRRWANSRADVQIRLPRGAAAELDLLTDDGRIYVHDTHGELRAESRDGRIEIGRVRGVLAIRTGDGSILGEDLEGSVDAETEDGRIRLAGAFESLRAVTRDGRINVNSMEAPPTGDWTLRTGDGSIRVAVPTSSSLDIEATTGDGRIVNRLEGFDGREEREYLRGRIGSGGHRIEMTTRDGNIALGHEP